MATQSNQSTQLIEDKEFEKLMRFYILGQMMQQNGYNNSRNGVLPMNYTMGNSGMYTNPMFNLTQGNGTNGYANNRTMGINPTFIDAPIDRKSLDAMLVNADKSNVADPKQKQYGDSKSAKSGLNDGKNAKFGDAQNPGYFLMNPTFVVQYTFHLSGDAIRDGKSGVKSDAKFEQKVSYSGADKTKTASTSTNQDGSGGMERILNSADGRSKGNNSGLYLTDDPMQNIQYILQGLNNQSQTVTGTNSAYRPGQSISGVPAMSGMPGNYASGNSYGNMPVVVSKAGNNRSYSSSGGSPAYAASLSANQSASAK